MSLKKCIALLVVIPVCFGCQDEDVHRPKFSLLSASESGVDFENTINETDVNVLEYVNMYNGAGVGVGDFNKDGFEDIFFGGNLVSSRLYLNTGKGTAIKFADITEKSGASTKNWVNGIAVVDVDQDGWEDIYCSVSGGNSAEDRKNLLFLNKGLDENGIPHFEEVAEKMGLDDTSHTIQSAFFDYDQDGDLDVFMIVNYPTGYLDAEANRIVPIKKIGNPERTDRLYRNDGIGANGHPTFTDVSVEAGITLEGFSLGLAVHDVNEDGFPDIYVANDYITNDILYINNGDGTFTDKIRDYVQHTSYSSMGIDMADINNDGLDDFMVLDMLPEEDDKMKMMYAAASQKSFELAKKVDYVDQYFRNTLQLNNGKIDTAVVKYSEIGQLSGVFRTNWSWSVLMPDLDLDGWRDIFITNGFSKDVNDLDFINYEQPSAFTEKEKFDGEAYVESLKEQQGIYVPNYIFRNSTDLTFEDVGKIWGIHTPSFSNGAVYADFDNDGDLDLAVNNINDKAFIYRNNVVEENPNTTHYLQLVLEAQKPNRQAIGAKVMLETSQGTLGYEHQRTRGYMSSIGSVINFGLGQDALIGKVDVLWPDGSRQSVQNVRSNQRLVIAKDTKVEPRSDKPTTLEPQGLFFSPKIAGLGYRHVESRFNDFDHHILLPHKLSESGPAIAVGDVDKDGLDDFYIGGSDGTPGQLFLQEKNGNFSSRQIDFEPAYEDQGCLLFDVDSDGDLDLYLVSGSVERGKNSRFYSDRLYINKGNRLFEKSPLEFPRENGTCAVAADFDRDGDLDIFVGGASRPDEYPLPAACRLLRNDSQKSDEPILTDVSNTLLPEIKDLGIVKSALWSDFDQDGWIDLFVVGEYMPITLFKNSEGTLTKVDAGALPNEKGLWKSINGADLDQDGDIDYVLGNAGLNTRYRPTKAEPITVYAADFDQNGVIDPIMTQFSKGREVPVHLRDDLFKQLIGLKKGTPTYAEYASAEIDDLLPRNILNNALTLQWDYAENACLMNDGNGKFRLVSLPKRAQIAPLYGTMIEDVNADGIPDILAVGNSHGNEVFSGWMDASVGTLLLGNGNATFKHVPVKNSGFYIDGDAKAMARLRHGDASFLRMVSQNNDSLLYVARTGHVKEKIITLKPLDMFAEIHFSNEKKERREFYYGSGYLSQSSRSMLLSKDMQSIKITNSAGKVRMIDLAL
ncbi:VCBS repeat-containing protein [Maribacter sp. 2210JD10-5]|uniref:VCBS repeat-containing protein n=1 Tax=Maribacter sp. 2210JD10-5 TaxID=3386272 RepID=UPI0039BC7F37